MELAIIPRFIMRKFFDETHQIHANVLMTSMLVVVVLVFGHIYFTQLSSVPHFCICQKVLNVPCPGCGVTRSMVAIAEGNILSAWKSNPAGLFLVFYLVAQIPLRIMALKFRTLQGRVSQMSRLGSMIAVSILLLVWIARLAQ
jgi:hypothetical protein